MDDLARVERPVRPGLELQLIAVVVRAKLLAERAIDAVRANAYLWPAEVIERDFSAPNKNHGTTRSQRGSVRARDTTQARRR